MPQPGRSPCKTTATRNGLTKQNFGWRVGVLHPSQRREPMMSRLPSSVRLATATAILLAGLTDVVHAQARRDRHVVGGRIATIAPAPAPIVVVAPGPFFGGFPSAFSPVGFFPVA